MSANLVGRSLSVATYSPRASGAAGGKYTTYRVMAKDAVDVAVEDLERPVPDSVTDRIPLLGADGYAALTNTVGSVAERWGLPTWRVRRLLGRYGSLLDEVLAPTVEEPALLEPLAGDDEYLAAEVRYAVTHEGAIHLEDVLTRRTRISVEVADRGLGTADAAAGLMAPVLGWDDQAVAGEVDSYRRRVEAELASQTQENDQAADASRRSVADPRQASPSA